MVAHRFGQRRPSDITRGQPRYRAVQVRVDHVRGEQAAHLPGRGDFVPEPSSELRIRGQVGPDHLDRDRPSTRRKAKEHPPHAATAQPPKQAIRPDRTRVIRLKRRYQPDPHLKQQQSRFYPFIG
jgi:hypothetical protein